MKSEANELAEIQQEFDKLNHSFKAGKKFPVFLWVNHKDEVQKAKSPENLAGL